MDARETLAGWIAIVADAEAVVARDGEAVTRATAMHQQATSALAAFDGLDARIGQHRAGAIRAGHAHALPLNLAAERDARTAAQREVDDLATALAHLSTERAAALANLSAAKAGQMDAAGAVMAAEAAEMAVRAQALGDKARDVWERLGGLLGACPVTVPLECIQRYQARAPLPHRVVMGRAILPIGCTAEQSEAERAARDYLARLLADPAAQPKL